MALATDFRVNADWDSHIKFIKISRHYSAQGIVGVFLLWGYAAKNRPDGVLTGMDEEDLLIVCKDPQPVDAAAPKNFIQTLVSIRLLDQLADGTFVIHDWTDHNQWAVGAKDRREQAKKAAAARWDKGGRKKGTEKYLNNPTDSCSSHADGNAGSNPLPSSSLYSKSPLTPQGEEGGGVTSAMILVLWNSILHELPNVKMTKSLERLIKERIGEVEERSRLDWWKGLFLRVSRCPDLMGLGQSGFKATLAWVLTPDKLAKVESGFYREEEGARQSGWTDEEYAAMQAKAASG